MLPFINIGNPVSNHALNRGLASWYLAIPQLMGGGISRDLCVAKNHMTLTNGPLWAGSAGRPGGYGAIRYDGSNDTATATFISANAGYTYCMWVNGDNAPGATQQKLMANGGTNDSSVMNWGHGSSTFRQCLYHRNAVGTYFTAKATTSLAASTWYHLTGSWDATDKLRIYVNGTLETTTTGVASINAQAGFLQTSGPTNVWPGLMDDIRVYTRCLSDSEVLAVYNDSRTGYPLTLNRLQRRVYGTAAAAGGVFNPYYYRMLAGHGGLGGAA